MDGAVRAPGEPPRVFFDPWVVGRTLKGDVKRDFHPARFGFIKKVLEVFKAAKCGED